MELTVISPDLFHSDGGIARVARASVLAARDYAVARSLPVTALALHDPPGPADPLYAPAPTRYRSFSGNRLAFAAAIAGAAVRPGLILCQHVNHAAVAAHVPRRAKLAVVVHGIEVWGALPPHRARTLRRADAVLAVSEYTRDRVIAEHGVDPSRAHVLHNCLDPYWRAPERAEPDEDFLLTVSRLSVGDRAKGVDLIIQALARARERLPRGLALHVAGDGPDRPHLEALVAEHRLPGPVRFAGRLTDAQLQREFATCRFFVLPSSKEGFGLVFLEAMAAEKAVIAARAGGAPEVVAHEETGLLVPPNDVDALAEGIVGLVCDPGNATRWGEAGRRRVRELFSFDVYRPRLHAALDALLDPLSRPDLAARTP
jgi:phosphatidylinositol alpha-1,6-mannosyltransferase